MTEDTRAAAPAAADERLSDAERNDLIQLIQHRAATYGFLSRLYKKEVDRSLLDELHAMHFPVHTGNATVDEGYRLIATYLSNAWANSLTELAIDYTHTFIGNGVDTYSAAYPFESVYTSERRLLMQEARDEVLFIYRRAGLTKSSTWKEGEDHLALELEYMQVLSQRSITALEAGDEDAVFSLLSDQLEFLNDHLNSWVGMLTADMKRFAKTELYQGLALLTEGFLETDKELLEDIIVTDE